jgi:hypothetical protein
MTYRESCLMGDHCYRCGAIAELDADGSHWCGVACLELARRGIPFRPDEAPLRLAGDERTEGVQQLLLHRRDQELDRLETEAAARRERWLERAEHNRYALPTTDRYGAVREGWLGEDVT